jgi:hypothetical protein
MCPECGLRLEWVARKTPLPEMEDQASAFRHRIHARDFAPAADHLPISSQVGICRALSSG